MRERQKEWHGLFLAAISSLFFSVCSLMAKFLSKLHPLQLSFFGFLGILIIASPVMINRRESLFPKGYVLLLLFRSFCGTVFLISSFYAAQLLPLGDASVLLYTAPVFTLILGRLILNEPCPHNSIFIIATIGVGVILVTQPSIIFSTQTKNNIEEEKIILEYWFGACAAITASISEAMGNISLRCMKNLHFSVIMTNYSLISLTQICLISSVFNYWSVPTNSQQLPLIALLAVFTCAEQILMTFALSIEHAGPVALIQACDIIYGYVYQIVFFGESFNFLSAFGAFIVASVVIYMTRTRKIQRDT